MTVEMRRKLVISLIVPIFLYASPVYSGTTRRAWDRINLAFNNCARYVFQKRKYDHISHFTIKILGMSIESYIEIYDAIFLNKPGTRNGKSVPSVYSGNGTENCVPFPLYTE